MNTNIFKAISCKEQGNGRTRQKARGGKRYFGGRLKVCLHGHGNDPVTGEIAGVGATVQGEELREQ